MTERKTCLPCVADAVEVADALRAQGDHAGAWGAATVANYLKKEPPFGVIGPPFPGGTAEQEYRRGKWQGSRESEARIAELEKALREVILSDCCGCAVYGDIAAKALGITEEQHFAMVREHEEKKRAAKDAEVREWRASLPATQRKEG